MAAGQVAAEEPPDEAESDAIAAVSERQTSAAQDLLSLDLDLPQACPPACWLSPTHLLAVFWPKLVLTIVFSVAETDTPNQASHVVLPVSGTLPKCSGHI